MITFYYRGAWIHENLMNNTIMVQLPIKNDAKYYLTKQVKSVHAAKIFISKNQEYINR